MKIQKLRNDHELIRAMQNEMKFVDDPRLQNSSLNTDLTKLDLITYFEAAYGDTDQDTVTYGPEFVIVVRNILEGKRPVKLRYLTEFDGEEDSAPDTCPPCFCEHANEVPSKCPCPTNCYCKANTCRSRA